MPRSRRRAGNHAGEKDRRVTRGRINCSGMLVRCHTLRGHGVGEGGIPIDNMEACTVFASISQLKADTASMIRAVCFLTGRRRTMMTTRLKVATLAVAVVAVAACSKKDS